MTDQISPTHSAPTHCLCLVCGTVSRFADWTFWQRNPDEATEEETPWVPSKPGETDPMAVCPACKWEHQDDYESGYDVGTLAEVESYRAFNEREFGEAWTERLAEVAT